MSQPKSDETVARPLVVLLIDDQAIVGETVRRMLAEEADIEFHFCQDPSQAIGIANQLHPTVILQDLVMPDIDGLMLVKFFRANKVTRNTPMVVLSSKEEPVIKAKAFAMGANDYLVKLPDKLELVARIRYHSRAYLSMLERDEAYRRLEESQRQLAEEVQQAAKYVQSLLPEKWSTGIRIDWKFVPSTTLGGDMFGYHWLDPQTLALYLLDVSGHGVGSSLLAVSAANMISARSLPETDFRDPGKVLTRLNQVFQMEKQNNKYFTIWYGVFERTSRRLKYANAGHPPGLLYQGPKTATAELTHLESSGPGIGMFPDWEFETGDVAVAPGARMLLYSDGVFEIARPEGGMWAFGDFVESVSGLVRSHDSVGEAHFDAVQELGRSDVLQDDFSMVDIHF